MTLTRDAMLQAFEGGLLVEAKNGLLRLRFDQLDAHVSAAHASVRVRISDMAVRAVNPYPTGTFPWAECEFAAGRSVKRDTRTARIHDPADGITWSRRAFFGEDIRALDWTVVT